MLDDEFDQRNRDFIARMIGEESLKNDTARWFRTASRFEYSYHFKWLGRPIIQFPQDIVALQEIIWEIRPSVIVETGVARGGSLVLSASLLELLGGDGLVVGIDIDIREHNRLEIERHPFASRIKLIAGSSVSEEVISQVRSLTAGRSPVLVILDSNHTHEHVFRELELYAPLVTKGSYLVVFDTVIEQMPADFVQDRPWGPSNNPQTALNAYLRTTDRFSVDEQISAKLQISAAPGGYLRCIK